MTINEYFYVSKDGEVVRVEAESYDRETDSTQSGGCNETLYTYVFTYETKFFGNVTTSSVTVQNVQGPVSFNRFEFGDGSGLYGYINEGNQVSLRVSRGGLRQYWEYAIPISLVATRADGQPETCPQSCITRFYRGSQTIHEIDYCPPISTEPPEEDCCCDCCIELAAIARTIRV